MLPCHHPRQGFTLIEVMLTAVIVALLAAIAVPTFIDQVRSSRRADAFDAVARVHLAQERHRSQNLRYAETLDTLRLPSHSAAGYYALELSGVSAQGFTLAATPAPGGRQAGDRECAQLLLRVSRGEQARSARSQAGADTTSRCWPQ